MARCSGNQIQQSKLPSNFNTERVFVTMKLELQRDIKCCTHRAAIGANQANNDDSVMNYYLGIADVLQYVVNEIEV